MTPSKNEMKFPKKKDDTSQKWDVISKKKDDTSQ